MTTYNSYEEAKIANPDGDIYVLSRKTALMVGKFQAINDAPTSHFASGWTKCDPSKYCMTVEKFESDGHKLVSGDLYLNLDGIVITYKSGIHNSADETGRNKNRHILRAAALETKEPKRTKEGYEKVEFIKLSDAALAVDARNIQFNKFGNQPIDDKALALHYYNNGSLSFYRRIETPIEWWEDASEFINQTDDDNCSSIMEGKLHVNATLTQDQWCDFARILLEQGE